MQSPEISPIIIQLVSSMFPTTSHLMVERVHEGVSTEVYRIRRQDAVFYLRILPEVDASFAPELFVHTTLRARRVPVPDVLYFEHRHPVLQRSVMLTTEIPGQAIGHGSYGSDVRRIVRQAGRALAQIHTIAVRGFGWIQRQDEVVTELRAEYPTHQEWIEQHVAEPLRVLGQRGVLAARDVQAIDLMMAEAVELFGAESAVLAHGDFDVTHIYQHQGRFAGIIDFGEIRGADQLYDLGHFQIENADLLSDLLAGYAEVQPLPIDYMRRILVTSLLIAVRRLGRRVARDAGIYEPDLRAIERILSSSNEFDA